MFDLSGKSALVTGASGGIGGAICRAFHAQGAAVMATGRRKAALDELAASLGERTWVHDCDLTDPDAPAGLVKEAESAMGAVDILVNNAGRTRDGLLVRMSDEDWEAILAIDLTAAFRLTRACLRGMMKRRSGRIINIGSVVGQTGNPGQANYAAAKAGIVGMTKALAGEVSSRGITVNCIAPGLIETPMTAELPGERRERIVRTIPVGRLGTPEEVAAGAVFLASEEASYLTGATLNINGGMAMI